MERKIDIVIIGCSTQTSYMVLGKWKVRRTEPSWETGAATSPGVMIYVGRLPRKYEFEPRCFHLT